MEKKKDYKGKVKDLDHLRLSEVNHKGTHQREAGQMLRRELRRQQWGWRGVRVCKEGTQKSVWGQVLGTREDRLLILSLGDSLWSQNCKKVYLCDFMKAVVMCCRGCRKPSQVCARKHCAKQWDTRTTVVPWVILLSGTAAIVFLLYDICKTMSSPVCSPVSQTAVPLLS